MYGFTNIFLIFAPENMKRAQLFELHALVFWCEKHPKKSDWYAKVLKYFQITSFFRLKLMQLEKNRYKKRNE